MEREFDWDDLKAFLAIMRAGRLTTAAKTMKVDHSTLSRKIIRLEDIFQTKLFERLSVGYRPTAAGEQLLREAETMESLAFNLQSNLTNKVSELAGPVRIAVPEGFGTSFIAPHIGQIISKHPKIEIELIAKPDVVNLSRREAEMAVTNICPEKGRMHAFKLTDYELGLYASNDYLSNHKKIKSKRDLPNHDFIGYIEDILPTTAHGYLNEISKTIIPKIRISNILTQLSATQSGVGLCVLPCFISSKQQNLKRILTKEIRIIRSFWLVTHSDLRELPRVRAASDFITETVRKERGLFLPK